MWAVIQPTPAFRYLAPMATQTIESSAGDKAGWSIEKAKALYNIEGWGAGFFDIDERGHVVVRPDRKSVV